MDVWSMCFTAHLKQNTSVSLATPLHLYHCSCSPLDVQISSIITESCSHFPPFIFRCLKDSVCYIDTVCSEWCRPISLSPFLVSLHLPASRPPFPQLAFCLQQKPRGHPTFGGKQQHLSKQSINRVIGKHIMYMSMHCP